MPEFDLDTLESQAEELIRICRQLREENTSLKARQEILVAERAELIPHNERAASARLLEIRRSRFFTVLYSIPYIPYTGTVPGTTI